MGELSLVPDSAGRFGQFGGRYVPETLTAALVELTAAYDAACRDDTFHRELDDLLKHYVGRPSPLYHAQRLSEHAGGAQIYLKREDLNHTGAHKINNTLGQALLTLRMGKRRVIAETGAGQHGVATATACARFGLECVVYMGEEDIRRQKPNVFSMRLLGAEVRPVTSGSRTLRDAINEAMRDWMSVGRNDALHSRLGGRAASVSADRARFSIGHRPRNDRAMPRANRPAAEPGRGLRRRRQQCGGHVLSVRRTCRSRAVGRRSRRAIGEAGRSCGAALARLARRACTAASAT